MLKTLEEYISWRKGKDMVNEFSKEKIQQNLKLSLGYVIDYYNDYLLNAADEIDARRHSVTVEKYRQSLLRSGFSAEVIEWFVDRRAEYKNNLKQAINHFVEDNYQCFLFNTDVEFEEYCEEFLSVFKKKMPYLINDRDLIINAVKDVIRIHTEQIDLQEYLEMPKEMCQWIDDVRSRYGVDLYAYMYELTIDLIRSNHPYDPKRLQTYDLPLIDSIYETVKHKPFLEGKKTQFEALFVYSWSGPDDPYFVPEEANNPFYKTKRQIRHEEFSQEMDKWFEKQRKKNIQKSVYEDPEPTRKRRGKFHGSRF